MNAIFTSHNQQGSIIMSYEKSRLDLVARKNGGSDVEVSLNDFDLNELVKWCTYVRSPHE